MALFLNPQQVTDLIKQAEREQEVIVIRCVRKTPASKPGGPGLGSLYDLHCGTKPPYTSRSQRDRQFEDEANGVLTVFATNRQNSQTHTWGDWRRVNVTAVQKVIYKNQEFEVRATTF
jgi:hypothetical protein